MEGDAEQLGGTTPKPPRRELKRPRPAWPRRGGEGERGGGGERGGKGRGQEQDSDVSARERQWQRTEGPRGKARTASRKKFDLPSAEGPETAHLAGARN